MVGDRNEWTLQAVASVLEPAGFEVIQARSAAELLDRARTLRPDLVVVSDSLGDLSAADTCRILRGMPSFSAAIPILVTLSRLPGHAERIDLLKAGAWDLVRLPANAEELTLRIRRFLDAKVLSDRARDEGMLDGPSGFYNFQGLLRRAEEETSEAWRFRRPLSCVVFGPDRTAEAGPLASTEGEPREELERELVELFRRLARRSDVVGRLGDTEFIVVAPSTDGGGAIRMGQRILEAMEELAVEDASGRKQHVAMRAGFYAPELPANEGIEPLDLVIRATSALRRSQESPAAGDRIRQWRDGDPITLRGSDVEFAGIRSENRGTPPAHFEN